MSVSASAAAPSLSMCVRWAHWASLTVCMPDTDATFLGLDGISLANGYVYVANQTGGTVSVCPANVDGSLAPCAVSSLPSGVAPSSVAINGAQAYVDDNANGNIYLCTVATGGALQNCVVSNGGTAFNSGFQIAIH